MQKEDSVQLNVGDNNMRTLKLHAPSITTLIAFPGCPSAKEISLLVQQTCMPFSIKLDVHLLLFPSFSSSHPRHPQLQYLKRH